MKIINKLKINQNALKLTSVFLAFAIATFGSIAALAWGPERQTYTIEKPADKVTFNSITNNPDIGDERNFVRARAVNGTQWSDDINVTQNGEYFIRMYVHNDAAENLNLVAENVTAQFNVPTYQAKKIQIDGTLSSSNASPKAVYDQVIFSGDRDFKLSYVAGSATYTNNVFTGGTSLSDNIINGNGATLGYDKLDGKIPGCLQYSGWVVFKVKAEVVPQGDFTINKTVRKSGDKTWSESVKVNPGDKVDYQIEFKNTGETQLKDVIIKDTLPTGISIVPGSVYLADSDGTHNITDGIVGGGTNIGGYLPNGNAYLKFTAQVAKNDSLPVCGTNTLKNIAKATTSIGNKEDGANVVVNKDCPKPKPAYSCDALTITKITRTKFEFNTNYTVNNTEFTGVKYIVKDSDGKTVTDKTVNNGAKLTYENSNAGKYTVEATALTKDGNATSAKCKGSFEIAKEDKPGVSIQKTVNGQEKITIEANKDFTYEIVVRNTGNVDLKDVVVSDSAPNDVKFISTDKGTITDNKLTYTIPTLKVGASETIKITAQATKTGISQKNTACVDTPTIPGSPDDCDDANIEVPPEEPVVPVTPETPEQPTTPTTPSELPQTGPADIISAVLGVGSVTAALGYYIASRKQF